MNIVSYNVVVKILSHKIAKINELIKHELSSILLREEEFGQGVLVTILDVKTSPDQLNANVMFGVWPNDQSGIVLKKLNAHIWRLQQFLNKRLKIHPVPKLYFALNRAEAESQKIEELIKNAKADQF